MDQSSVARINWQRQVTALYPDLEWNKPERRDQAGRLLIIGGNQDSLYAPLQAVQWAREQGIGQAKLCLPSRAALLLADPSIESLASTRTGEFSLQGLDQLLMLAQAADNVLLAGELGRNSQTSTLLERFFSHYRGNLTTVGSCLELVGAPTLCRSKSQLVLSFGQLQKLGRQLKQPHAVSHAMGLHNFVDWLALLTTQHPFGVATWYQHQFVISYGGQVVTTKKALDEPNQLWCLSFASLAASYQTWYPDQPLQVLAAASWLEAFRANHQPSR